MASKRDKIAALKKKNPKLSTAQIAKRVKCDKSYVRKVSGGKSGDKTVAVLSDLHFPYQDSSALNCAVRYCQEIDPDVVVLNGDIVDFYQVSHWAKDPSRAPFAREIERAKDFLVELVNKIPRARFFYVEGNHEERLSKYIQTRARELHGLITVERLLGLDKISVDYVRNKELLCRGSKPFSIDGVYFAHGHEVKIHVGTVNKAKSYFDKLGLTCIVGHHHTHQEFERKNFAGEYSGVYMTGCFCKLAEDYSVVNSWMHGLIVVEIVDGVPSIKSHKIRHGRVI